MQSRTAALCRLSPTALLRQLEDILGGEGVRTQCEQLVRLVTQLRLSLRRPSGY